MKYIDADRFKAEIEKHIKEVKNAAEKFTPNMGFFDAKLSGIYDVMAIIDSLQQEQPEVDLEKEMDRFFEGMPIQEHENIFEDTYQMIARHFYELGLNARKEEKK